METLVKSSRGELGARKAKLDYRRIQVRLIHIAKDSIVELECSIFSVHSLGEIRRKMSCVFIRS